jgi:tellurite resistance protein
MKKVSRQKIDWCRRDNQTKVFLQKRMSGIARGRRLSRRQSRHFSTAKLRLPSTISLGGTNYRTSLVQFIRKLKDRVSDHRISNVVIDFSKVTELHPCGTLLLVAEIERMLQAPIVGKKLSAMYPKDRIVEQMFQYIHLLERLGLEPRIDEINASNVVAWLYASGHEGDLDSITEKFPKILTEGRNIELRTALLSGMAEAVANSSEHAYEKSRKTALSSDVQKKWWLFARQVDDDVAVVICDLGFGIPGTLEANWKEELASYLKSRQGLKRQDHKMIQLAFTVGKTSTNKKNRGKGLKDILKVVKEQGVGELCIYSNRGVYALDNNKMSEISHDEKNSIRGTIIQWKIPIEAFGFEVSERL